MESTGGEAVGPCLSLSTHADAGSQLQPLHHQDVWTTSCSKSPSDSVRLMTFERPSSAAASSTGQSDVILTPEILLNDGGHGSLLEDIVEDWRRQINPLEGAGPATAPSPTPRSRLRMMAKDKNMASLKVDIIPVEGQITSYGGSSTTMASQTAAGNNGAGSAPKSPINVQEWVDSIDILPSMSTTTTTCDLLQKHHYHEHQQAAVDSMQGWQKLGPSESELGVIGLEQLPAGHVETQSVVAATSVHYYDYEPDNFGLGAEARHLEDDQEKGGGPSANRRKRLVSKRESSQSFQSELSATSTASSVSALLETMRDDPEEILENLGFGSSESSSPLARIPHRFLLRPSAIKGNDVAGFLVRHEEMQEINDTALSGYLGLSGYRTDGQSPSGIVSKILEKILERKRELKQARLSSQQSSTLSTTIAPRPGPSFFQAAFSVMAINAFRNSIRPPEPPAAAGDNNSILEPKNRQSSTAKNKRSRKLVLGEHSLTLNSDEELVDDHEHRPNQQQQQQARTSVVEIAVQPAAHDQLERQMSDDVFLPVIDNTVKTVTPSDQCIDQRSVIVTMSNNHHKLSRQFSVNEDSTSTLTPSSPPENLVVDVFDPVGRRNQQEQQTAMSKLQFKLGIINKPESFELEELPNTVCSDVHEWISGDGSAEGRVQAELCADSDQRTGSAMSVSSGFLEYEALDAIKADCNDEDVISRSSPTPNMGLDTLRTDSEVIRNDHPSQPSPSASLPPPLEMCPSSTSERPNECVPVINNCSAIAPEVLVVGSAIATIPRDRRPSESDAIFNPIMSETNHDDDLSSCPFDEARQLSSNFIAFQLTKSQSEANLPSCTAERRHTRTKSVSSASSMSASMATSPTKMDNRSFVDGCVESGRVATLTRFWSNVGSVDSHLHGRCKSSSGVEGGKKRDGHYRSQPKLADAPSPFKKASSKSAAGSTEDVDALSKNYWTEIARMRNVMRNYTAQLRDVERSCWETYHQRFPGLTHHERKELKMLGELRIRILEEASRTSSLLQSRMMPAASGNIAGGCSPTRDQSLDDCHATFGTFLSDPSSRLDNYNQCQYVDGDRSGGTWSQQSNKPQESITPTSTSANANLSKDGAHVLLKQECESTPGIQTTAAITNQSSSTAHSCQQVLMKQEIMQEVRSLLRNDQQTFLRDIEATRREIMQVKEVVSGLMNILQTIKKHDQ